MNEVFKIIDEYKEKLEILIKDLNKEIREYKDVYFALKPKGKEFKEDKANLSMKNPDLYKKIIEMAMKTDVDEIVKTIKNKRTLDLYNKETENALKRYGLSKEIIYSDEFINNTKGRVHDELLEMRQREEELSKKNKELDLYICDVAINMFEDLEKKKEYYKSILKGLTYAKENIKKEELFNKMASDSLDYVLNDLEEDKKIKLVSFIQKYNKSVEEKRKNLALKKTETNDNTTKESKISTFIDCDAYEDEREKVTPVMVVAKNYLDSIEKLDEASLNEFLDYISIKNNFISIISYMISFSNDDSLRKYLEKYLENIINFNMEEKESAEEDNRILYYGFTASKKYLLKDIDNISEAYYKDILKAINRLKRCNWTGKKNLVSLDKTFEMRQNDIRITVRKLNHNTYVILGIYCKKMNRDRLLVKDTLRRSNNLDIYLNNDKINYLWDSYYKLNEELESNIIEKLNCKNNIK